MRKVESSSMNLGIHSVVVSNTVSRIEYDSKSRLVVSSLVVVK